MLFDQEILDKLKEGMITFEIFLSILASLLIDRYLAFIYIGLSWIAPWMWHLLDAFHDYWSDDTSDTDSDVSNWEEW